MKSCEFGIMFLKALMLIARIINQASSRFRDDFKIVPTRLDGERMS